MLPLRDMRQRVLAALACMVLPLLVCASSLATDAGDVLSKRRWGPYCGVTSLYAGARLLENPDADLQRILGADYVGSEAGSSLSELSSAADVFGVEARPVKNLSCARLRQFGQLAILHVKSSLDKPEYDHYVPYMGDEGGEALIMDAPDPPKRIPYARLATFWNGNALLLGDASDGLGISGGFTRAAAFNGFSFAARSSLGDFLKQPLPDDAEHTATANGEELRFAFAGGHWTLRFHGDRLIGWRAQWAPGDVLHGNTLPYSYPSGAKLETHESWREDVTFSDFRPTALGVELPHAISVRDQLKYSIVGDHSVQTEGRRRSIQVVDDFDRSDFSPIDLPVGIYVAPFDKEDKRQYVWDGTRAVVDEQATAAAAAIPRPVTRRQRDAFWNSYYLYLIAGGGLLLVGLALVVRRRQQQQRGVAS